MESMVVATVECWPELGELWPNFDASMGENLSNVGASCLNATRSPVNATPIQCIFPASANKTTATTAIPNPSLTYSPRRLCGGADWARLNRMNSAKAIAANKIILGTVFSVF